MKQEITRAIEPEVGKAQDPAEGRIGTSDGLD